MSDYISIIAILISAIGWYTSYIFNIKSIKKNKKIEIEIKFRENYLKLISLIIDSNGECLKDNNFMKYIAETHIYVQIYGNEKDIKQFQILKRSIETSDVDELNSSIKEIVKFNIEKIRGFVK